MSKRECDIDLYAGLSQVQSKLVVLEARVAALEADNSPGGLEGAPDNTPGGDMCEAAHVSGLVCTLDLDHDGQHVATGGPGIVLQTWTDPEPAPQWRALVDSWAESGVMGEAEDPLAAVLWSLHRMALLQGVDHGEVADALARIVAVAEAQVGDGWKAGPGRVPHGHWGIAWLMAPLSHEPPNWVVVADRAAAWLRDLTDGAS